MLSATEEGIEYSRKCAISGFARRAGHLLSAASETICPGDPSPSPNFFVNGPVHSAAEGNNPPSSLESYNAYFVSENADCSSDILNIEVFSYTLPPTIS